MTGNTVLITGGASGIGLSMARAFLERGNTVIVCGRNTVKLDQVRGEHPAIHTVRCDVASPADVTDMVAHMKSHFPLLNILVNNAGIQHQYDFVKDDQALKKIEEEIGINFRAVAHLTHMLLPTLVKASEAAVVNVSSFLGIVPKKSAPIYCATKAALHAFSKSLRYQLRDTPVKVFEVIPPMVDTEMTRGRKDAGKMSPESLAAEVLREMEKDHYEIKPGRAKFMLFLNRAIPFLIQKPFEKR